MPMQMNLRCGSRKAQMRWAAASLWWSVRASRCPVPARLLRDTTTTTALATPLDPIHDHLATELVYKNGTRKSWARVGRARLQRAPYLVHQRPRASPGPTTAMSGPAGPRATSPPTTTKYRRRFNQPAMQLFGRPATRAARAIPAAMQTSALPQWRGGRAIAAPARLYSTLPPFKDANQGSAQRPDSAINPNAAPQPAAPQPADGPPSSSVPSSELPPTMDSRRSKLNQRLSTLMDNLQSRVLTASHVFNNITGYSAIEVIKVENEALEVQLADAKSRVRTARHAYKSSNTKRATTQREVTTLLARKDSWSPADLERFTQLYRTDHVLEGEVAGAQEALTEAEAEEQSLGQRLNVGILKRYHEEQIWSDRIRKASGWSTLGLIGMNLLLFVVLQFVAEPWRRKRLVRGIVEVEKGVLETVRNELEAVRRSLEKMAEPIQQPQVAPEAAHVEQVVPDDRRAAPGGTWQEVLMNPARWKPAAADLYSERRVDLRMRDVSMLALEGALAGAAVAGSLALLLVRRT
ncbi:Sensitive to high expression protein 9, mitochondrial [Tolypocladium capitatum]|uniref:Sensitive to high expression protein 9, mitochondrial n=1 Tax=Tolypocladium capitatum TaxID=45235 RepID=A0A2K3Q7M0_9HYPO|nr:Sensitive to high expression protein 9, mitochondrial [Tolypocladium capitatum]